jgi:nanoRNase/pAp phosphatase (c-di-AMP/oligoRNAs hydrolase)
VGVGSLMLKYGGGGHKRVGACQVSYEDANITLHEILHAINKYSLKITSEVYVITK